MITIPVKIQVSRTQTNPCTPEKRILVNLNMHTIQKPIVQKPLNDQIELSKKVKKVLKKRMNNSPEAIGRKSSSRSISKISNYKRHSRKVESRKSKSQYNSRATVGTSPTISSRHLALPAKWR